MHTKNVPSIFCSQSDKLSTMYYILSHSLDDEIFKSIKSINENARGNRFSQIVVSECHGKISKL